MRAEFQTPDGHEIVLDDGVLAAYGTEPKLPLPRRCYAAGHVVMQPGYRDVNHSLQSPGSAKEIAAWIDWEPTMALRKRHDSLGMGIAEAMDTAQRFELGWVGAKELLRRTGELNLTHGFVGAASTDQRASIGSTNELVDALIEQVAYVRSVGGLPILLPQLWLSQHKVAPDTYFDVYTAVINASEGELLLHWLGEAFHSGMRGYFPGDSLPRILAHDPAKVRGLKLSLLDRDYEERMRANLAGRDQVILTGDDYHFGPLIEGAGADAETRELPPLDGRPLRGGDFSHALLGIFDTISRPASVALSALDAGDTATYRAIMEPCEALGRLIFEAPVQHYKAGIAFIAYLNGFQDNPYLANHEQRARSDAHYLRVAELASLAGAIENASVAAERLHRFLATDTHA